MSALSAPARHDGALRFARYAYPPNALGYCGPADAGELLALGAEAGAGPEGPGAASARHDAVRGLADRAARFEGAWPYLQLVAACNGIADPLDDRVVEAYWIGNGLLDRVPPGPLLASVRDRFARRVGRDLDALSAAVPLGATAHHSFHVFGVYPWLGMLRGGLEGAPLTVLDRCRIRWGTVLAESADRLVVRSQPLVFDGWRLVPGAEQVEEVRRAVSGVGMLPAVRVGDVVSLHWDWACDRLSASAAARLRRYSERTLRAVNGAPTPGPALVCERGGR